jgi:hypothetical protein
MPAPDTEKDRARLRADAAAGRLVKAARLYKQAVEFCARRSRQIYVYLTLE